MRAVGDRNRQLLQKGEGVPAQGGISHLYTASLEEISEDFIKHDERWPGGVEQPTQQVGTGCNLALIVLGDEAVEIALLATIKLIRHLPPERACTGGIERCADQTSNVGRGNLREPSAPHNGLDLGQLADVIGLLEQVIQRQQRVRLATPKGRLELDNRLRPSCSTEPTHDINQQLRQAVCEIGLREERLGIPIIHSPSSSEDFAQVGSEDGGVELALANVSVWRDD